MRRCPGCGGFFDGDACPHPHTEPFIPLPPLPVSPGSVVHAEHSIGSYPHEQWVESPALVLGVSADVAHLVCFVAESGGLRFLDVPVTQLVGGDDG